MMPVEVKKASALKLFIEKRRKTYGSFGTKQLAKTIHPD